MLLALLQCHTKVRGVGQGGRPADQRHDVAVSYASTAIGRRVGRLQAEHQSYPPTEGISDEHGQLHQGEGARQH